MQLFHVGDGVIAPGRELRKYRLAEDKRDVLELVHLALDGNLEARTTLLTGTGRLRRRFRSDPTMQLVLIEAIFERVRLRVAPGLPSRFDSVFLWPTLRLAQDFRERYRSHGLIHRCVLVEGDPLSRDASFVAAGMDLSVPVDDEVRKIEQRAVEYWRADAHISYPEVLVQGIVVVTEVLAPGT